MEEKFGITSLDLKYLIKELKNVFIGGIFRKIYQWDDNFIFVIYVPKRGEISLYFDPEKIFLTSYKKKAMLEPQSFCMFLRKHLMGKVIIDIRQHEFDRIIEIETKGNILILEMIRPGNIILCDTFYNIIMPLKIKRFKDRAIVPKVVYRYPPKKINPFQMDFDEIYKCFSFSDKKLIVFLSVDLGFGSVYAKEICLRSGIKEDLTTSSMEKDEVLKLYETVLSLENMKIKPVCYGEKFVSPFPLRIFETETKREFITFSDALDYFFSKRLVKEEEEKIEKGIEKEKERIERIIKKQEEAEKKWEITKNEARSIADIIYKNYSIVDNIINGIQRALSTGMSWEEIKKRLDEEKTPEAEVIKEIKETEGIVIIFLDGKEIEIDFRKSVEENAERYYEKAKRMKKKILGVKEAKEKQKRRLEKIPEVIENGKMEKDIGKREVKKKRRKWYERFKWFITSDGFLVVAGRNAKDNEMIYRRYLKDNDLVFHANIHGASLVVLKSNDREITDEAKREASEFAAVSSKAWTSNLAEIDVYCVKSEQVSKTPPSGEYLPKGSFMIRGPKEWYRDVELKLSIGVRIDDEARIVYGPVISVRKHSTYFITIKPGFKSAQELAKEIKNKILIKAKPEHKLIIERIPLDDIQSAIPGGKGEIIEYT